MVLLYLAQISYDGVRVSVPIYGVIAHEIISCCWIKGSMMEQHPHFPIDLPSTYRICVTGGLENGWAERLWGMTSIPIEQAGEREQTLLAGKVADQAALVGIINALYNMGYAFVSVERTPPDAEIPADEMNKDV